MVKESTEEKDKEISIIRVATDLNHSLLHFLEGISKVQPWFNIDIKTLKAIEISIFLLAIWASPTVLNLSLLASVVFVVAELWIKNSRVIIRKLSGKAKFDSLLEKMDYGNITVSEFQKALALGRFDTDDINKIFTKAAEKDLLNLDFQNAMIRYLPLGMSNFKLLFGDEHKIKLSPEIVIGILHWYPNQLNKKQIENVYGWYKNEKDIIEALLVTQEEAYPLLKEKIEKELDKDRILTYKATMKYNENPSLRVNILLGHGRGDGAVLYFLISFILSILIFPVSLTINLAGTGKNLDNLLFSIMFALIISSISLAKPVKRYIWNIGYSRRKAKIDKLKKELMKEN